MELERQQDQIERESRNNRPLSEQEKILAYQRAVVVDRLGKRKVQ